MADTQFMGYRGGFVVCNGDENLLFNYTAASGSPMRLQRNANTIFEIVNGGALNVTPYSLATDVPAVKLDLIASDGNPYIQLYDREGGQVAANITVDYISNGYTTKITTVVDPADASTSALTVVADAGNAAPDNRLFSFGYTDNLDVYQETFYALALGEVYLKNDLLWAASGNIGEAAQNRPNNVYAATSVVGGGSVVKENGIDLGPSSDLTSKTITALQGASSPYIKFVVGSPSKWQFSNDGTTPLDFGTSNVTSWDDLYAADQALTIDGSPLAFTQSATTGVGFLVEKTIANADSPVMRVQATNSSYDQPVFNAVTYGTHEAFTADRYYNGVSSTPVVTITSQYAADSQTVLKVVSGNGTAGTKLIEAYQTSNPRFTVDIGGIVGLNQIYDISSNGLTFYHQADNNNMKFGDSTYTNRTNFYFYPRNGVFQINNSSNRGAVYIYNNELLLDSSGHITQTAAGNINLTAGTGFGMTLTGGSNGATLTSAGGHVYITSPAAYDVVVTATNHSGSDIFFNAHNSGNIPFNSTTAGQTTLTTTAQNIVGAINELDSSLTWDGIYANDKSLLINSTGLTWTQTSASGAALRVDRALNSGSTTAAVFQVNNFPSTGSDDQAAIEANLQHGGGAVGTTLAVKSFVEATAAMSSGDASGFYVQVKPHASDTGGHYYGLYAEGLTDGGATKIALNVDAAWDYGLYSAAPANVTIGGINATTTIGVTSSLTTSGTTPAANIRAFSASMTAGAGATGDYAAYYAAIAGTTSGTKYAFLATDKDFDYSLYAGTPVYITADLDAFAGNAYAMQVVAVTDSQTGSTSSGVEIVHVDTGGSGLFNGLTVTGDASTSVATTGISIDANWDFGFYSNSKVHADLTALNAAGTQYAIRASSSPASGGFTSTGRGIRGLYSLVATDPNDVSGTFYRSFEASCTDNGGSAETAGFYAGLSFDYGVYSLSPGFFYNQGISTLGVMVETTGSMSTIATAVSASVTEHLGDSGTVIAFSGTFNSESPQQNAAWCFYAPVSWDYSLYALSPSKIDITGNTAVSATELAVTSSGTTTGAYLRALLVTVEGNASDTSVNFRGVDIPAFVANGGTYNSARAINIAANWDYSIYASSKAYIASAVASGGGSGETWITESVAVAAASGLPSNDQIAAFKASITDDNNDSSPYYYGFYATTTNNGPATDNKYGFYIDDTWQKFGYSFRSESGLQHFYSTLGSISTPVTQMDLWVTATISNASEVKIINVSATPGADADGSTWVGVNVQKFSATDKYPSKAINVVGGAYYWDFGLYLNDTSVLVQNNMAQYELSTSYGSLNVVSGNSTAFTSGAHFSGLRVLHTGNASDSGGDIYGCYIGGDGNQGSSGLIGYVSGPGTDIGFYSGKAPNGPSGNGPTEAFYALNGRYRLFAASNVLPATSAGLFYCQYTSTNISSGNHFGYHSRYVYATDTGGAWFGYLADTSGTPAASLVTYGFRAQSTLDIGFDSYAATNNFIRNDDVTSSTAPIVNIDNLDNDSTGGAVASLKVANTYNATTAKVIEIDSAYTGAGEQTRRAIVFSSAKRNSRAVPLSTWCRVGTSAQSNLVIERGGTFGSSHTTRWYTTTNDAWLWIPLHFPHDSAAVSVAIYMYCASTFTVAPSVEVHKHPLAQSQTNTGNRLGNATGSTASGVQTITVSCSGTIDNAANDYYALWNSGTSAGQRYIYTCLFTYDITDYAAACGW